MVGAIDSNYRLPVALPVAGGSSAGERTTALQTVGRSLLVRSMLVIGLEVQPRRDLTATASESRCDNAKAGAR
jgi:hypothetical protein